MLFNGVTENPAPVDEDSNAASEENISADGEAAETTEATTDDETATDNTDGEAESSSKKPARAKGKKTMTTKGKKAAKGSKKTAAKKASKPAKTAAKKKANGGGARPDSKMSQAVAFMKAERSKLDDPKAPPRGFRKELIERTAKKFGLAVATCSTQYGAKVGKAA